MDKARINRKWEYLKVPPEIEKNQIQVWKVNIPDYFYQLNDLERFLNANERKRAASYKFEDQRQDFIVVRGILRFLLSHILCEDPETLHFKSSSNGKPRLDERYHKVDFEFNISHSEEICLIAMSRNLHIGIDIEAIKPLPNLEEMAKKFLSEKELDTFYSISSKKQLTAFYNFWSAKEALLKELGCGLLIEPRLINLHKIFEKNDVSIQQNSTVFDLSQIEMIELVGIKGYVGWLASERKAEGIRKLGLSGRLLST